MFSLPPSLSLGCYPSPCRSTAASVGCMSPLWDCVSADVPWGCNLSVLLKCSVLPQTELRLSSAICLALGWNCKQHSYCEDLLNPVGFPASSGSKESACNKREPSSISRSLGAFQVAQWQRICLPEQETGIWNYGISFQFSLALRIYDVFTFYLLLLACFCHRTKDKCSGQPSGLVNF